MQNLIQNLDHKKIFIFFVLAVTLWIGRTIPYVNLLLEPYSIFIILYIAALILFRFSSRVSILVGIFSILMSFPWILIGSRVEAEKLGNFAWFVLLTGVLQEAWRQIAQK